jgi:hypothetical protein
MKRACFAVPAHTGQRRQALLQAEGGVDMTKKVCVGLCLVVSVGLLLISGCNGTTSENTDLKGQVD